MTKVKEGKADPTQPNDHNIEIHEKTISGGSSETVSWDYVYASEPLVALSSDTTPDIRVTSKGTSQCTIENRSLNKKNDGRVVLTSGNTSKTVTHNLGTTPSTSDIQVTPLTTLGSATEFYIDKSTVGSSDFDIAVDQDPGQDIEFSWGAEVEDAESFEADVEIVAIGEGK